MPIRNRFNRSLQMKFEISELDHEIRQMQVDLDYSQKQGLLIRQAIEEKEQVEKNEQSIDEFHLMISEQSGLEPQEVKRRCDRKKRVLGTVEEWLCIALVAREQGLDVTALASNLR